MATTEVSTRTAEQIADILQALAELANDGGLTRNLQPYIDDLNAAVGRAGDGSEPHWRQVAVREWQRELKNVVRPKP